MRVYVATVPAGTVCAAGLALRVKFGAAVPVPLSVTVCGEPVALSATERMAAKEAAEVGEKVSEMVQLEAGASETPQVVDWAKALGSVPVIDIPVMPRAMFPVFERVTTWAALVTPLSAVKLSDDGVREAVWTAAATVTVIGAEVLAVSPASPL